MSTTIQHDFHLPLPDELYRRLLAEAARSNQPADLVARQAIETWLKQKQDADLHRAIATYAAEYAGSDLDLDSELEAASIEH